MDWTSDEKEGMRFSVAGLVLARDWMNYIERRTIYEAGVVVESYARRREGKE